MSNFEICHLSQSKMKRFNDQAKQIILNVLDYLDRNQDVLEFKKKRKTELAAEMLKISERSVYRLQKCPGLSDFEYKKNMSSRISHIKTKVNPVDLMSIREIIYKMVVSKEYITIKLLHDRVMEEIPDFNVGPRSLTNWIRKIGFKFKKNSNRLFLMEWPSGIPPKQRKKCI